MNLVLDLLIREKDETIQNIRHSKLVLKKVGLHPWAYDFHNSLLYDNEKYLPQLTKAIIILRKDKINFKINKDEFTRQV